MYNNAGRMPQLKPSCSAASNYAFLRRIRWTYDWDRHWRCWTTQCNHQILKFSWLRSSSSCRAPYQCTSVWSLPEWLFRVRPWNPRCSGCSDNLRKGSGWCFSTSRGSRITYLPKEVCFSGILAGLLLICLPIRSSRFISQKTINNTDFLGMA